MMLPQSIEFPQSLSFINQSQVPCMSTAQQIYRLEKRNYLWKSRNQDNFFPSNVIEIKIKINELS